MRTYWLCYHCKQIGVVSHDPHEDISLVRERIGKKHDEDAPSRCVGIRYHLQALNITEILEKANMPEWALEPLTRLIDDRELDESTDT